MAPKACGYMAMIDIALESIPWAIMLAAAALVEKACEDRAIVPKACGSAAKAWNILALEAKVWNALALDANTEKACESALIAATAFELEANTEKAWALAAMDET